MMRLLRAQARRDRWQLLIWILGTAVFAVGSGSAVLKEFGDLEGRKGLLQIASGNPALLALRGIPDGTATGSVINFELFTYLAVLAGLMSTFLVVRHSRGDEEQGRTELLRSTPIGRASALGATVILGTLANLAIAVLIALGFMGTGLPALGSILCGLAVGGTGLAFVGIAALAAQIAKTGRAANSIAGIAVGVAWGLRALGDALGSASKDGLHATSAWPSWLTPVGWGQQVRAFGGNDPLPLLLDVALFALTAGIALVVVRQRDLGAGLVGDCPGPAGAGAGLRSSFGLTLRLQRSSVIGWTVGAALLGLFAGGLADTAVTALKQNPAVAAAVQGLVANGGSGQLLDTFVAAIMAFLSVLAAGAALQAVLRARSEEADGHSELLLAGRGGTGRSLPDSLGVALLSLLLVALAGGIVGGLAFVAAGHPERFGSTVLAAFAQLPAAAVFAAIAGLVFAVLPRATVGVGWGILAIGFVLGQFGALLKMPEWIRDISPFSHTPVVPADNVDWAALAIMAVIAIVVALAATVLVRRRDLVS